MFSRSLHYSLLSSKDFALIKLACNVYTKNCFFSSYFTDNTPSVANLRSSDVSSTSVTHTEESVYIIRARIINTRRSSCKMPGLFSFRQILIWLTDFSKNSQHKSSRKFVHWKPSCSMRMDGQTDMSKLTTACTDCFSQVSTIQIPIKHACRVVQSKQVQVFS